MRLLIMACSARKRDDAGLLPAIHRYDGPAFRTLRAFQRAQPDAPLTVMILSARYGLLRGRERIHAYDQLLRPEQATRLRPQVARALGEQIDDIERFDDCVTATLIMLGTTYRMALPPTLADRADLGTLTVTHGGIGQQLGQLKRWLHAPMP